MLIKNLLEKLDLGNSVAEFDQALQKYFVETQTFRALISDRGDIIAGDKGTGKTALYRILRDRYPTIPELAKVEVLPAFNPVGNPVFQNLAQVKGLQEGQYISLWKSYFLSLVGNWVLQLWEGAYTDTMSDLDELLRDTGLRSSDDSATTIFSKIVNWTKRLLSPTSAEVAMTVTESGIPIVLPTLHFDSTGANSETQPIRHEEALGLLDRALADADITVWVVLDRLDEAFVGHPEIERPALRALLRSYLDLVQFPHIRLKLFLRNDIFRKIADGGFVNLTHVNARRIEIRWDEPDLMNLLCRRIRESPAFVRELYPERSPSDQDLFSAVFPEQVDSGPRKSKTWAWIMSRIRDGNHVKPPRNLIDLVKKAQEAQLRREERDPRAYSGDEPIVEPESIKRALTALSEQRVEDTLLAEAGDYATLIDRFRDGKAEHSDDSLAALFGITRDEVRARVKPLLEIGFIEQTGNTYKVPILYREGLAITQGKAF